MEYEKAMEILSQPGQQGFQHFLTLNAHQLAQLIQVISEEHQSRIHEYLKKKNHIPLNPDSDTQPQFSGSIKKLYQNLFFDKSPSAQQGSKQQPNEKNERNEAQWFRNLFVVEETKEKIKENQFNYPYFSVIRKLLTCHNAPPFEDSVKGMHSLLQILMKRVFSTKLMDGLKRSLGTNKQSYNIPKQEAQRSLNVTHIKNYLSKIFQKEYSNFKEFKSEYSQIKKDIEVEPSEDEEEEESEHPQPTDKQLHSIADTEEEIYYYILRTQKMNAQDLVEFYKFRQTNFIKDGSEKLITFTKIGGVLPLIKNRELLQLLSYILCMTVRKIIFIRIREISGGKLLPLNQPVSSDDIQRIGNQYIEEISKKAKSYCLKYQTYISKAFELFSSEFYTQGYDQILGSDTKIKLTKSDNVISETKEDQILEGWKKNKEYRKGWYERVVAEAQLKQLQEEEEEGVGFKPVNEYAQYLNENQSIFRGVSSSKVFKSFLFKQPLTPHPSKPQKRLQSLFK